ncbi:hypothetical protein [Citrobacter braakii]|uniref:hypothetical protein n=1 Tax=Citrobacter braakii TaxID=57706 RepID=UPI004039BF78
MKVVCIAALLMLLPGCSLEFSGGTERVIDVGQCRTVTRRHVDARMRLDIATCAPGVSGALCRILRNARSPQ